MKNQNGGFNLLELIVALFLFIIIVPLFASLWPIHHRAVNQSKAQLGASHICRIVLEDAISAGFDGVEALKVLPVADRTITLNETVEDQRTVPPKPPVTKSSEFVWTINTTTSGLMAGEKLITAQVDWTESGEAKSLEMTTLLAEDP